MFQYLTNDCSSSMLCLSFVRIQSRRKIKLFQKIDAFRTLSCCFILLTTVYLFLSWILIRIPRHSLIYSHITVHIFHLSKKKYKSYIIINHIRYALVKNKKFACSIKQVLYLVTYLSFFKLYYLQYCITIYRLWSNVAYFKS